MILRSSELTWQRPPALLLGTHRQHRLRGAESNSWVLWSVSWRLSCRSGYTLKAVELSLSFPFHNYSTSSKRDFLLVNARKLPVLRPPVCFSATWSGERTSRPTPKLSRKTLAVEKKKPPLAPTRSGWRWVMCSCFLLMLTVICC